MKSKHIVIVVLVMGALIALLSVGIFNKNTDLSSYESIASAMNKQNKFVHLIASLDKEGEVEFDALKNPNYTSFYAKDTLGNKIKVVYNNPKPSDLEKSEKVVLKGYMRKDYFECKEVLLKCPSKYKEEKGALEKEIKNGDSY